jgi:hypothetical protein
MAKYSYYFNQLSGPYVIVGDFNAHHMMWEGGNGSNTAGLNLVESLEDFPDFTLLTPFSIPIYFNAQTGSFSTLDLCFVSMDLRPLSHITLEAKMGSDHEPVLVSIGTAPSKATFKARQRLLFHKGSWGKWQIFFQEISPSCHLRRRQKNFLQFCLRQLTPNSKEV